MWDFHDFHDKLCCFFCFVSEVKIVIFHTSFNNKYINDKKIIIKEKNKTIKIKDTDFFPFFYL